MATEDEVLVPINKYEGNTIPLSDLFEIVETLYVNDEGRFESRTLLYLHNINQMSHLR